MNGLKGTLAVAAITILFLTTACSDGWAGILRDRLKARAIDRVVQKNQAEAQKAWELYQVRRVELFHDGLKRSYYLYVPKAPRESYPLVFIIHGGGGSALGAVRMADMNKLAEKEGFIVAYPNGTGPLEETLLTFNAGNCCGEAYLNQVNDTGFFRAMTDDIGRRHKIDGKRIYAAGLSNGGKMAYRLAYEASDLFAAVSPVEGSFDFDAPAPVGPVSLIIFHGTKDEHILYEGGIPKKTIDKKVKRVDKSVAYAVSYWVRNNGANPVPRRSKTGSVIRETYSGGRQGTEIELYTIEGQGHAWPGGKKSLRYGNVDPPTKEISATELMWEFFKTHPKK